MKILIITQKVASDDSILGFFYKWIYEFSKNFEKVYVVCLEKGKFDLPKNVEVFSLGKEGGRSKLKYIFNFYRYIFKLRNQYDTVFVHMNPEYLVLGGWWWRLTGKKITLWYVHRQVSLTLKIAELFANKIFTASKEAFNLKSQKLEVVGHGIPLELFEKSKNYRRKDDKFRLLYVGRIDQIKNLDILIEATNILQKEILNLELVIVGKPTQKSGSEYFKKLKNMIVEKRLEKIIRFAGSVSNEKIREYYWDSDISINLSPTGGIDKTVLESMASSLPVFVSNRAFEGYLGEYKDWFLFRERDPENLAEKILRFKKNNDRQKVTDFFVGLVKEKASLASLIAKITKEIQ